MKVIDPLKFIELVWPHVRLYDKQKEILYSVANNDETLVPAGNALGKDFVAALCALWFFCSRRPARVVTTSVKHDQLNDVLWGEIRNFLQTAVVALPIHYNHMKIRQVGRDGQFVPRAELVGQVVSKGESILGRHIPRGPNGEPTTLLLGDEISGMETSVWEKADTWAHRKLGIGNCYECENFFRHGVEEGDLPREGSPGYYRRVIRIKAEDSPNVIFAQAEIEAGRSVSNRIIIPGVVDWPTYTKRRRLWNPIQQSVGLDAQFYEGAEVKLYPKEWLERAKEYADSLAGQRRTPVALGIDPAEGGDNTAWVLIDDYGIIEIISERTPDTTAITDRTKELIDTYDLPHNMVLMDRGGGGKQHADRLRRDGYMIHTVAFGESVVQERRRGTLPISAQKEHDEQKYVYKNRRAEMYGMLRIALDPAEGQFGIPRTETELLRQMKPIPYTEDAEGRLYVIPKNKPSLNSQVTTLTDILGCSPDELDALVMAYYIRNRPRTKAVASAL